VTTDIHSDRRLLYLESTVGSHSAALATAEGSVLSRVVWPRAESRQDNLDDLLGAVAGDEVASIGSVVVDIGPGNLATTRACVAYANALAFAMDLRVAGVNSLDVMAVASGLPTDGSAVVRVAGPHGFYARLQRDTVHYRLVDAADAAAVLDGLSVICASDKDVEALGRAGLPTRSVRIVAPTVDAMVELWVSQGRREITSRSVEPLNETGAIFDVRT